MPAVGHAAAAPVPTIPTMGGIQEGRPETTLALRREPNNAARANSRVAVTIRCLMFCHVNAIHGRRSKAAFRVRPWRRGRRTPRLMAVVNFRHFGRGQREKATPTTPCRPEEVRRRDGRRCLIHFVHLGLSI